MAVGAPVSLPRPGYVPDPYQIYMDKCIITANSDEASDHFDFLINDSDADTDVEFPAFILPVGAYVLDVGVQWLTEITTAGDILVGINGDSDFFFGTDSEQISVSSDLSTGVVWASRRAALAWVGDTTPMDSTGAITDGVGGLSGVFLGNDSTEPDYSSVTITGTVPTLVGHRSITFSNQGAVAEAGTMAIWIMYSFAGVAFPALASSDLAGSGD